MQLIQLQRITFALVFVCLEKFGHIPAQTNEFVRDCNNPLVAVHPHGHSYCFHACGSQTFGTATCASDGYCICPCSATEPEIFIDPFLCPPRSTEPDDPTFPDATALARCMTFCASGCTGGIGEICSESFTLVNPVTGNNVYAKICICACPPTDCNFRIPSVITTTTELSVPTTTEISLINKISSIKLLTLTITPFLVILISFFILSFIYYLVNLIKILGLLLCLFIFELFILARAFISIVLFNYSIESIFYELVDEFEELLLRFIRRYSS